MNRTRFGVPLISATLWLMVFSTCFFVYEKAVAGGHYFPPVNDSTVAAECGSCHLAFPPAMLPARSWTAMMGDLENHFGDDASLDTETVGYISRYLTDRAGDRNGSRYARKFLRGISMNQTPLRITELPKWAKEHRKIQQAEWSRSDVQTKANCTACHKDGEQGYYDD